MSDWLNKLHGEALGARGSAAVPGCEFWHRLGACFITRAGLAARRRPNPQAGTPNATRICFWALVLWSWFFFCAGLFWRGFGRDRPAGGLAPFDKAVVLFFCRWPERVRALAPWPRERIGTAAFPCW